MSEHTYTNTAQVALGGNSHYVRLSEEGFTLLLALAVAHQVCEKCYQPFTEATPNVSGNCCLTCFLASNAGKGLTFQGALPFVSKDPGPYIWQRIEPALCRQYWYLSAKGFVYTSSGGPNSSHHWSGMDSTQELGRTLDHWRFPQPTEADYNGQTVPLGPGRLTSIHGDVQEDRALCICYQFYHSTKSGDRTVDLYFLTVRNQPERPGGTLQINTRKPDHRALLTLAEQKLPDAYRWEQYQWVAKRLSQELTAVQTTLL